MLKTSANNVHVRINTSVDASEFPNRRAGDAVLETMSEHVQEKLKLSTYSISFLWAKPYWCRLLAAHHQVDVVLGPQTVGNGG